jgi:hypothetical protein
MIENLPEDETRTFKEGLAELLSYEPAAGREAEDHRRRLGTDRRPASLRGFYGRYPGAARIGIA